MTNYTRATVMQLSEHLHLCMVKAINTALSVRLGADWFTAFKEYDSKEPIPVLEKDYTSVNSMDMQSCFKFFRYREEYAKIVFAHYGHNFYQNTEDAIKATNQLRTLLDNLIRNVRNYLYAHASANMVENGSDTSLRYSVYGANEAVNDMLKLAGFFDKVYDSNGASYYSRMLDLTQKTKSSFYPINATIKKEKLKVDSGVFITACSKLNIPVSTDRNGELVFSSSNYAGDLAQITLFLNKSKKGRKAFVFIIFVLIIAITVAAILVLKPWDKNKENKKEDNTTTSQSEKPTKENTKSESTSVPAETPTEKPTETLTEKPTETLTENYMYGEVTEDEFTMKIDQEHDDHITIYYENGGNQILLATMPSCFIVETESGNHLSCQLDSFKTIAPYTSDKVELYFDNIDEKIVSVSTDIASVINGQLKPTRTVTIPVEYK